MEGSLDEPTEIYGLEVDLDNRSTNFLAHDL